MTGPVVVTGAGGFVGRHVCRALHQAGVEVRAVVRRGGSPAPEGVEVVEVGGLLEPDAGWIAAGASCIVHLAGRAHVLRERNADPANAFNQANVETTRALLHAGAGAGVRTFLLMSSIAAVGTPANGVVDEHTPVRPESPYGRSKGDAEELVLRQAAAAGMRPVVVRAPMVFGPGMKGNPLRLLRLVAAGIPVPVPVPANVRSMVYAGNLATAIQTLLAAPTATGVFCVDDGTSLSTAALVRQMACALGRPARLVPIPTRVMRAAGRAGDVAARWLPCPLTSDLVRRLFGSLRVDGSRLRQETGFQPTYPLDEALRRTVGWFRSLQPGG